MLIEINDVKIYNFLHCLYILLIFELLELDGSQYYCHSRHCEGKADTEINF